MATLGSGWTLMASASTGFQGVRTMYIYARLKSQDTAKNQSVVETHLDLGDNHGWSGDDNTTFQLTGAPEWSGKWSNSTGTQRAGSVTITHKNDGTGSVTVGGRAIFHNTGHDTGWHQGSISLPTIPRASQPSVATWPNSSPDIVAGESTYIHMNRKSDSFTHSIYYTWMDSTHRTAGFAKTSGITYNVEFIPPLELLNDFPNAATGWGTIYVTTWNGNTNIGTKSCKFTLHVPDDAAPDISAEVSETGALPNGTTLKSLGVSPDTGCYNILSKLKTHFSGAPKYGASLTNLYILINGAETDGEIVDGATNITVNPSNNAGGSFKYSICAKDSRGAVRTVEKTIPFNDYRQPAITSFVPIRDDSVGDTGRATGNGTSYYGRIGSLTNSLSGTINYNDTDHAVTLTQETDGTWTTNLNLTNVPASNSFNVTLTVKDAVGYSTSYTATLAPAVPTLWIGEKTVRVRSHLCVNQSDIIDLMYPIGSIYMSTKDIDPSTLMPDTEWTKLESGTFIEAAGDVAGEKKEAGLPNINGALQFREMNGNVNITSTITGGVSGPFNMVRNKGDKWSQSIATQGNNTATANADAITFDAHQADPIYGNSTTVQPKSITVFMWQRTA